MPTVKVLQVTELGKYGLKQYVMELQDGDSKVTFILTYHSGSPFGFGSANISRVEAKEIKSCEDD